MKDLPKIDQNKKKQNNYVFEITSVVEIITKNSNKNTNWGKFFY